MTIEPKSLEVFQDCALIAHGQKPEAIRKALLGSVVPPWRHNESREKEISSRVLSDEDFVAFERETSNDLPPASLVIWSSPNGYEVSNIVPIEFGKLSYAQYNSLLQDFVKRVVEPASKRTRFEIRLTSAHQSLEDWVSPKVAKALRSFSAAANKSTGSSHPMDRDRWFRFIVAAHQEGGKLDTDRLARWLHEIDGWDNDSAHELAIEYEFGLALLEEYDRHRP